MTRLEHCLDLVGDIRDCASRAKDLGEHLAHLELNRIATGIEDGLRRKDKPSLPPVLASNQAARAKADEHFRAARKILQGIIR